jgi:hypothetical protein
MQAARCVENVGRYEICVQLYGPGWLFSRPPSGATSELGHNLGLIVVAEGVKNIAELSLLKQLGCNQTQGYFISQPLVAPRLEEWPQRSRRGLPANVQSAPLGGLLRQMRSSRKLW